LRFPKPSEQATQLTTAQNIPFGATSAAAADQPGSHGAQSVLGDASSSATHCPAPGCAASV